MSSTVAPEMLAQTSPKVGQALEIDISLIALATSLNVSKTSAGFAPSSFAIITSIFEGDLLIFEAVRFATHTASSFCFELTDIALITFTMSSTVAPETASHRPERADEL